jgi:Sulfatase-modifying factor enzyme 1
MCGSGSKTAGIIITTVLPTDGSAWTQKNDGDCDQRVIRGGSWLDGVAFLRVSNRGSTKADVRSGLIGFRVARDIEFDNSDRLRDIGRRIIM